MNHTAIIAQLPVDPARPPNLPRWATGIDEFLIVLMYLIPRIIGVGATIAGPVGGAVYFGIRMGRAMFPGFFAKTEIVELIEEAAGHIKDAHPDAHKASIKKVLKDPKALAQLVDAEPSNIANVVKSLF